MTRLLLPDRQAWDKAVLCLDWVVKKEMKCRSSTVAALGLLNHELSSRSTVVMLLTQKLRTPASCPSVQQYKLAHWSMSSLNLLRIALQILLYTRVSSGLLTFILWWREHFHHWMNPESVYMLGAGRIFLLPTTLFCLLLEHVFAARHRICP